MHTLNFYMHTLNFFSQQMLLHPLKHFPTNVAASIEMENNGSFEMRNLKSGQKWQKEVILAITSNCQNYLFLPLLPTFQVSHFKRTIVLHFNGCSNICWEMFQWMQQHLLGKEVQCVHIEVQCVHQSLSVYYCY